MNPLRALKSRWIVLRARFPLATGRAESAARGLRGYPRLVSDVHGLRRRMHELERDHALLAAHVATLTEQAFGSERTADSAALERARLSAVAAYEHRISALEQRTGSTRHARERGPAATGSETLRERRGSPS